MHQLQHKRIPREIEFFDEHGTPVTNQIQHEDNPNDTCNDFYPKKYKRGNEEKILRIQNDGEDLTVTSMLDEFPITSIQQAADCFRMGRFINQFGRICGPETQSSASVNTSNTEYSSMNSLSPSENNAADSTTPAMTQTTSVQILKMTILYGISVFKLTKPDSASQTSSRLGAWEN